MYDLAGKRVFVAGHRGMVGGAIARQLADESCDVLVASRTELDLRDRRAVAEWMEHWRPHAVFLAAAKVGGIVANDSFPADFLLDNLLIETSVIEAAYRSDVEKLVFLGSSCIYPKFAPQPIPESALLTGPLEPTNEWYAIAKIAGIKLAQAYRRQHGCDFISAMPTNLYGPGDNYNLETSHVIPALIRKAHTAKLKDTPLVLWGSGEPRREFLFVDDCANACITIMKTYSADEHINVGSSSDIAIRELAALVCEVIGFHGEILLDTTKPDGTPRKLMDSSRLRQLGWQPKVDLRAGLKLAYRSFLEGRDALAHPRGVA